MNEERQHKTILLVEDDPLLAATMRRYLERLFTQVSVAGTVAEAQAVWTSMTPDVVLMDYRLPDGWGTEVVERMRALGREESVVGMTAEAEQIHEDVRQQLRIREVLSKPVQREVLLEALAFLQDAEPRMPELPAAIEPRPRKRRRIGKFRKITARSRLTAPRVARLWQVSKRESWVAFYPGAAEVTDPAVWRGVCAWAGWLSAAGGRLYVVVPEAEKRREVEAAIGAHVDVIEEGESLAFHGMRLTGTAERKQLMQLCHALESGEVGHGG